jgi:hypothetical protein
MSGTLIEHASREWLEAKFINLVNRFETFKESLGAKSFPSYGFMLTKLLILRGIKPIGVKMPKMPATRNRAERVWTTIQDAILDWTPSSDRQLLLVSIDACPDFTDIDMPSEYIYDD